MCMQTFKEPFTDTYSMDTLDIIDYIEPSKLKKRQKDKALFGAHLAKLEGIFIDI